MIPVPGLDLAATHRALADEIEPAVLAVLRSGHYILGPEVQAFETAFSPMSARVMRSASATGSTPFG